MAILVTGGTKGIGLAIARRFAKPGSDVFLNYLSDHGAAGRAREAVAAAGARAHLLPGDVGTPEGLAPCSSGWRRWRTGSTSSSIARCASSPGRSSPSTRPTSPRR